MDQYLSTVVIAVITGVFSIITLIIQKKQDKVIDKIDQQTVFIEKEKKLKKELTKKQEERDSLIHSMIILIMETNLYILKNTDVGGADVPSNEVLEHSKGLKTRFNAVNDDINEINRQYDVILELSSEYQKEAEKKKT